jgi:hypothetical protein
MGDAGNPWGMPVATVHCCSVCPSKDMAMVLPYTYDPTSTMKKMTGYDSYLQLSSLRTIRFEK